MAGSSGARSSLYATTNVPPFCGAAAAGAEVAAGADVGAAACAEVGAAGAEVAAAGAEVAAAGGTAVGCAPLHAEIRTTITSNALAYNFLDMSALLENDPNEERFGKWIGRNILYTTMIRRLREYPM